MGKVLQIGAGGVGTVVAHKMAGLPDVFSEITLASRTQSKCDAVAKAIGGDRIKTAQVDADNVSLRTPREMSKWKRQENDRTFHPLLHWTVQPMPGNMKVTKY